MCPSTVWKKGHLTYIVNEIQWISWYGTYITFLSKSHTVNILLLVRAAEILFNHKLSLSLEHPRYPQRISIPSLAKHAWGFPWMKDWAGEIKYLPPGKLTSVPLKWMVGRCNSHLRWALFRWHERSFVGGCTKTVMDQHFSADSRTTEKFRFQVISNFTRGISWPFQNDSCNPEN